jgi:zinc finger protein
VVQREFTLDARCPACGAANLVVRSMTQDLPYFGATLLTTVECPRCDFRHATSMQLEQKPPRRHTLRIERAEDLEARVVRSHSGTFRVPELGFAAEPAEASEAFVSNVEGVLDRVRDVLVRARLLFADDERGARAEELLAKLQAIREGREPATLVLEDPHGNSAILSERAVIEALSAEEAALLRTGVMVLDREDLSP